MSNRRYIRTLVDNKPAILELSKCNFCPYFKVESGKGTSICRKYSDFSLNNFIAKLYSYSIRYTDSYAHAIYDPVNNIDIPDWCKLNKSLCDNDIDFTVYIVENDKIVKIVPKSTTLFMISDKYVKYEKKSEALVSTKISKYDSSSNVLALPQSTITNKIKLVCSCCGELVESVERNKNFGMCEKCWSENSNDVKIKRFSFINNFRLKRSSVYSKKIDKIAEEIKI